MDQDQGRHRNRIGKFQRRSCATMAGLESCWPMTAPPAASRSCRRTICSMRPTGTGNPRRSRRTRRRRISAMAISSGCFPARSAGLRCSASTASRSSSIPNSSWCMVITGRGKERQCRQGVVCPRARRALARDRRQIRKLVACAICAFTASTASWVPAAECICAERTTPVAVICAPETSLIWPAGHDPSSTRMRWPSRKSTMSCSRETCCASDGCRKQHQTRLAGSARYAVGRWQFSDRQIGLPHLLWIFSPLGPTLICRPSGCFLVW